MNKELISILEQVKDICFTYDLEPEKELTNYIDNINSGYEVNTFFIHRIIKTLANVCEISDSLELGYGEIVFEFIISIRELYGLED